MAKWPLVMFIYFIFPVSHMMICLLSKLFKKKSKTRGRDVADEQRISAIPCHDGS